MAQYHPQLAAAKIGRQLSSIHPLVALSEGFAVVLNERYVDLTRAKEYHDKIRDWKPEVGE